MLIFIFLALFGFGQGKSKIILDADTGNEVDDLFAVSRALLEPSWEITALNATQWQSSQWAEDNTMENSHRLNQVLVGEIGVNVLTRRGGVDRMFDWGDMAQHSAAAYEIIKQAAAVADGERIKVVALGALTNVASAIYIEPSITKKIELHWLGTTYDFENDIMKKLDFNCLMDPQALDVILNSEVEFHIIPVSVAVEISFTREEVESKLKGKGRLGDFLADRWTNHLDGSRKERIIWDLALIEAVIYPELMTEKKIRTSSENGDKEVFYIESINVKKMKEDFYEVIDAFHSKQK